MFTNSPSHKLLARSSVLCAVALLGAACGGAGEDDPAGASSETGVESDPLLAGILDGKTFEEAEFEVQTRVQECMTALGWEYTAVAPGSTGGGPAGDLGDFDADEFAATSGYGISTQSVDGGNAVVGEAVGTAVGDDPNNEYINSLSASEQTTYYNDLFGPPVEADASGDAAVSIEPAGCMGDAMSAVYGEGAFDELGDQFAEVDERLQSDPSVIDLYADWAACMSAAGYSYTQPNETFDDFMARLQALGQEPDAEALASLQAEEIATAKADRACAKEIDLDAELERIFREISTQVASGS